MSAMWLEFNMDFRDIIEPYKDYVRGLYMDTKKNPLHLGFAGGFRG